MAAKQTKKYSQGRAVVALGKGHRVSRRMERVVKEWTDVWMNGHDDLMSYSRTALTSGHSWSRLLGASSTMTFNALAATINSYATILGCAFDPDQGIEFEFDAVAEDTDPVYFEVPEQFTGSPTPNPLSNPKGGPDIAIAYIDIGSEGGNVYSFRLINLVAFWAAAKPTLSAGDYYEGFVTAGTTKIAVRATYTG